MTNNDYCHSCKQSLIEPLEDKSFSAKCILFGEHLVLKGHSGLVLPLPIFSGKWVLNNRQNKHLKTLYRWIEWLEKQTELVDYWLDIDAFKRAVDAGYRFESNIPPGYGVGSSGALVASVAYHFQQNPLSEMPVGALQGYLARMECFFHGNSSGLDPLVSYLNKPILTRLNTKPSEVEIPVLEGLCVFLVDTRQPRLSSQLIGNVREKNEEPDVAAELEQYLIPASNAAIYALLNGDVERVLGCVDVISRFQFHYWPFLYPENTHRWVQGSLATQKYRLKICGTGGGGFMLGFARNIKDVKFALPQVKIIQIL